MDIIALQLESALKDVYDFDVLIKVHQGEVIIYGLENNIEEVKALVFIHGYLYCLGNKNEVNLRIFKEA